MFVSLQKYIYIFFKKKRRKFLRQRCKDSLNILSPLLGILKIDNLNQHHKDFRQLHDMDNLYDIFQNLGFF